MMRLIVAFFLLFVAWPAAGEDGDYFTDEAMFAAAWGLLLEEIGPGANLQELTFAPQEIAVKVQAPQGGPRVDAWRVQRSRGLFRTRDAVSGPDPVRQTGPVGDVVSGFFPLASVPLGRLRTLMAEAVARAGLIDPAQVASVRIARRIALLPQPHYGEVRWTIAVTSGRETATAEATEDGVIFGIDISGTHRGRNRNFLTQDNWPFAAAGEGFHRLVPPETGVFEVSVSRLSVAVEAVAKGSDRQLTTFRWDGGMFTRGLVDLPNIDTALPNGDRPFTLGEIDFGAIPAVIAAARARAPAQGWVVRSMRATMKSDTLGPAEVLWRVVLSDKPQQRFTRDDDDTIVTLKPDGTVVSVLLPRALRPKVDFVSGEAIAGTLAQLADALGPDAVVYELMFRRNRASAELADPARPGEMRQVAISDRGLRMGMAMPAIVQAGDRFTLGKLAALDAAAVEAIKTKAVAAIAVPGGAVYRMRFWDGAPFWSTPDGGLLVDVRVGVPPGDHGGGYAVFTLDGTLVDAVR